MTSKLSAKFLEMFKYLKSDAVPKAPRNETISESETNTESNNENIHHINLQEDVEEDVEKSKKKPKYKKSFSEPNRDTPEFPDEDDRRSSNASNVNTQASGNVVNIVNSSNVHCGPSIVYNMGPVYNEPKSNDAKQFKTNEHEEDVEKTNLIVLLLEADTKLDHDYIDYVSKHLGKNWQSFFRKLGYTQGWIETMEIDMGKCGVAEVRYKILLDWIRNDDDGTLGKLATVLWECGERVIVKELAAMYSKSS